MELFDARMRHGQNNRAIVYVKCKQWNSKSFTIQFQSPNTMASMCSIASDPIESQRIDSHNFIRITRNIQFVGYNNTNRNYVPTLSPAIASNTTAILTQLELAVTSSICQIQFVFFPICNNPKWFRNSLLCIFYTNK